MWAPRSGSWSSEDRGRGESSLRAGINKIDTVDKPEESAARDSGVFNEYWDGFDAIIPISARTGRRACRS
jgi:hypothetical protein